jgi:hypothetical protein
VVILQLVDIVAVPLWAGHVVSGASISAWDIVKDLLLLVLAPLAVGLFLKVRYPDNAKEWQPGLVKVSNIALVIALGTGIAANWKTIVTMFGSWVILTAIIIVIVGLGAGALLGGKSPETRANDHPGIGNALRLPWPNHHWYPATWSGQLHRSSHYLRPGITHHSYGIGCRDWSQSPKDGERRPVRRSFRGDLTSIPEVPVEVS